MNIKKVWLGVLAGVVATAAYAGVIVHGQLIDASAENLGADPTSYTGRFYLNTVAHTLKFYTGSAWRTIADTSTTATNPMTTQGDIIYEDVTPAAARLAKSTATTLLHSGSTPSWSAVVDADVDAAAAIAGSKLVAASSSVAGAVTAGSQVMAGAKTWNDVQTWKYSSGGTTAGSYDTSGQFTIGPSGATSSTTHTVNGNIALPIAGTNLRLVGSGTTANNGAIGFADESNVFTNGLQMQALGSTSSRRVAFFGGTSLGTEVASVYATGKLKVGPGSANGVISFNDAVGMYLATSSANQTCSTTCTGVLPLSIAATVCISGWNSTDNLALATCGTSPGAGKNTRCLCAGIF